MRWNVRIEYVNPVQEIQSLNHDIATPNLAGLSQILTILGRQVGLDLTNRPDDLRSVTLTRTD